MFYGFFSLAKFISEFEITARNIPCDTIPQKNTTTDAIRQPTAIFEKSNIWQPFRLATKIFFNFFKFSKSAPKLFLSIIILYTPYLY